MGHPQLWSYSRWGAHAIKELGNLVGGVQVIQQVWVVLRYGTLKWLRIQGCPGDFLIACPTLVLSPSNTSALEPCEGRGLEVCCSELVLLEHKWDKLSAENSLHHLQVSASIVFDSTDSLWMKAVDRPWSALAAVFISAGMPVN